MKLTISEVKERLFNKEMLELLIQDYEAGYAMSSMDSAESADYFNKSLEERASMLVSYILKDIKSVLYNGIKDILKEEK